MTSQITQTRNIKVPKETADLVRVYCIFNNTSVKEFITKLIERELKTFKKSLKEMREID